MNRYAPSRRRQEFNRSVDRFNRRLTGWALGTGLLAFHAGVFFLTMTGLIFWNVYDKPNDFWTGDLLKRWGAVLVLHAVVTLAATTGWRLLRSADIQEARPEHWRAGPVQPLVADGRWRALESGPAIEPQPYVPASEPDLPKLTAAQRFRAGASRRVATLRGKADEVSPETAARWPAPPARRDPEADELIRQFGNGADAPIEAARGQVRGTWIEAAATSWLTKDEAADGAPPDRHPRAAPPSPPLSTTPSDDDPLS